MTNRLFLVPCILLLAQACTLTSSPTPTPKASSKAAAPTAKPSAAASGSAPVKAAPALLVKPAGSSTVLAGQLTLDANYIVAQGGGNIVAQGGGNLITNDGGSLITNDGGSLAVEQGNAIISNDGASLITNDGGSLITNDGGSLITNDGAGYTLTAAPELAVGQVLPVGGAQVAVRSLTTGKLLPLGKDAQGKDVMTIVSNRQGKFEVYLPADEANNVRVETAFRAGSAIQAYSALAQASAASVPVDEETQVVAEFAVLAFTDRLQDIVTASPTELTNNRALKPFLEIMAPFREAAAKLPADKLQAACRRGAELMLSRPTSLTHAPTYDLDPADPALMAAAKARNEALGLKTSQEVLLDSFRTVRRAVVARMRQEAQPLAYFDNLPQVVAYRALLDPSFHVTRAGDVPRFLIRAYMSSPVKAQGGLTISEATRVGGLAGFMEGGKANFQPLDAKWLPLFPADLTANSPPALSALATGAANLGADAIPANEAYRVSSGTRAINAALLEVLFLQGQASDDLRAQLLALLR